jgi:predicted MFS family arabinose efflux permease
MTSALPRDFQKLWAGQTISFFGSEVTAFALPLTAVLVLGASASEMGMLVALQHLPMALFGLVAGVWIDRLRRRPILAACSFLQAVLLASIPIAWMAGRLSLTHVYLVSFGSGTFFVISQIADRAYLPTLLSSSQLMRGNAKIALSGSVAQTVGPGFAGVLVQWLTAPIAIAFDAASYLIAGLLTLSIRTPEPKPPSAGTRTRTVAEVKDSLVTVMRHPLLRPLVLCTAMHNICSTMIVAVYVLYLTRELAVTPFLLSLIFMAGGLGAVCGSILTTRLTAGFGVGPSLILMQAVTGIARLLVPLAMGSLSQVVATLMFSQFLLGTVRATFNVTQFSLRQTVIEAATMARVNATIGFLFWAVTPLGALAGGYLGDVLGVHPTLWIAASGVLLSTGFLFFSRLRSQLTLKFDGGQ